MDWADNSAKDFLDNLDLDDLDWTEGPGNIYETLAKTFRKAFSDGEASGERKGRASGMRDACDEFEVCGGYTLPELMAAMREQASQIEKGQ